jgi:hypothetical protein
MASKMGLQVDPQLLIPVTDPSTDQMAIQETQNSSMAPSTDPNIQGGAAAGGPPPGGDPAAGGAPGPAPVQPMDAGQGPIGKAASHRDLARTLGMDEPEEPMGQEYSIPRLRKNREKAAAYFAVLRALGRAS